MYIRTSSFVSLETTFYTLRVFNKGLLTQNATWCQNRGCICISSVRRTYGRIHSFQFPAYKYNNSVDRIISKEEEREDPRRDSSIYLRVQWCFHILQELQCFDTQSSKFPVIQAILHTELILLQEISKKYYNYKAHPVQITTRHLPVTVPVSPSILHGRIRLPATLQYSRPTRTSRLPVNSTRQKQHSKRQPASTQPLQ